MSTHSLETVALEEVSSSKDYPSLSSDEYQENGPCDSSTSRRDDLFYSIIDITPPEPTGCGMEEVPFVEDGPDQSHCVGELGNHKMDYQDDDELKAIDIDKVLLF